MFRTSLTVVREESKQKQRCIYYSVLPANNLRTLSEICLKDKKVCPTQNRPGLWSHINAELFIVRAAGLQGPTCWVT